MPASWCLASKAIPDHTESNSPAFTPQTGSAHRGGGGQAPALQGGRPLSTRHTRESGESFYKESASSFPSFPRKRESIFLLLQARRLCHTPTGGITRPTLDSGFRRSDGGEAAIWPSHKAIPDHAKSNSPASTPQTGSAHRGGGGQAPALQGTSQSTRHSRESGNPSFFSSKCDDSATRLPEASPAPTPGLRLPPE